MSGRMDEIFGKKKFFKVEEKENPLLKALDKYIDLGQSTGHAAAIEGNMPSFDCNEVAGGVGIGGGGGSAVPVMVLMFTDIDGRNSPMVTLSLVAMMRLFPLTAHAGDVMLELLQLLENDGHQQGQVAEAKRLISEGLGYLEKTMPPKQYAKMLFDKLKEFKSQ